ncbi:MAG: SDR family NAD(P)-dependent oxidoreductase, partial [Anaerolineales bacterium]
MRLLENKWALVTGSSRGIGQQIALGLAQRKCNIIVHGREDGNTAETLERLAAFDVQTFSVAADLAIPQQIEELVRQVQAGPGAVDI